MKKYYSTLRSLLRDNEKDVVEIGSGDAEFMIFLSKNSNASVKGCDIFEHAGKDRHRKGRIVDKLKEEGIQPDKYQWYSEKEPLPFDSNSADVIISLQVLEHVKNIDLLFSEIHRVLKPGGRTLHYFPSKEILIEPHCRVPLAHRLKRKKEIISLGSRIGLGKYSQYSKERGYSLERFSNNFASYIEDKCFFRSLSAYVRISREHNLSARLFSPPPLNTLPFVTGIVSRFTSIYLEQQKIVKQ